MSGIIENRDALTYWSSPTARKITFFEGASGYIQEERKTDQQSAWQMIPVRSHIRGQGTDRKDNTEHNLMWINSVWMKDLGEIKESIQWPVETIQSGRTRLLGNYQYHGLQWQCVNN